MLGISVDFPGANQAWAEKLGLKYPLLSDLRRDMSRAYGVLNEDLAMAKNPKMIPQYFRAKGMVIVLDKNGIVRYTRDTETRGTIPVEEVLAAVEKMK